MFSSPFFFRKHFSAQQLFQSQSVYFLSFPSHSFPVDLHSSFFTLTHFFLSYFFWPLPAIPFTVCSVIRGGEIVCETKRRREKRKREMLKNRKKWRSLVSVLAFPVSRFPDFISSTLLHFLSFFMPLIQYSWFFMSSRARYQLGKLWFEYSYF